MRLRKISRPNFRPAHVSPADHSLSSHACSARKALRTLLDHDAHHPQLHSGGRPRTCRSC